MVYTVTLNPAIDYDVYMSNFNEGELNEADSINIRAGGKGINVSKVLKNLETETMAMGILAGFSGNFIVNDLVKNNIKNDFIYVSGITRINVKLKNNNRETEITGISPKVTEEDIKVLIQKLKVAKKDDIVVFSGSIPKDIKDDIYKTLSKTLNEGVKIVLDTRGNLLIKNLHNNFLIKPNISELEDMAHRKINSNEDIVKTCEIFLKNGVSNIIVSSGSKGAVLVTKDKSMAAKAPKGKLINSIGAGDSMIAGFVSTYLKTENIEKSFKMAVASGSATAFSYNLGEKDSIYELYDNIEIQTL